jgi:Na+-translocating ferredoxin:NAD+ oxidoreductase subunit G
MLYIRESWLLIVASLCFGFLLAGVNYALKPKIEANSATKQNMALRQLLTEAETFETVLQGCCCEAIFKGLDKNNNCVGWVFKAEGAGYADKIELLIAVDGGFNKILSYKVLFSNETVGFGDKIKDAFFRDQFAGAPVEKLELLKMGDETIIDGNIIAISGATVTSNAVVDIFNNNMLIVRDELKEKGLLQ